MKLVASGNLGLTRLASKWGLALGNWNCWDLPEYYPRMHKMGSFCRVSSWFYGCHRIWRLCTVAQLLHHCGRWPEPISVLVMDNASFHRSEGLEQMCADAGVKLVYATIFAGPESNWRVFCWAQTGTTTRKTRSEDLILFLEWCINVVGAKEESARGHFRHAGMNIEDFDAWNPFWPCPYHSSLWWPSITVLALKDSS